HTLGEVVEAYKEEYDESKLEAAGEFTLAGRMISLRIHGRISFAHLRDYTGRLQILVERDVVGRDFYNKIFKKLDVGDFLGVKGTLFRTKTGELTLKAREVTLLSKVLRPLPEKWHGLKDVELRYRQRYLDLIANEESRRVFVVRSEVVRKIREFLVTRGFMEVETPMMQPIPGGAAARPFVTHHNALDIDLYLRIAPELYLKRLVVGGFDRVFELGKCFRNEGISTEHNPEFTMVEFYMAYADYMDLMDLTEELISSLAREILGTAQVTYGEYTLDLRPPYRRITFHDALLELGKVPPEVLRDEAKAREYARELEIEEERMTTFGKVLGEIFEKRVEPFLVQPIFVYDYPRDISPLAKSKEDDPSLVERFEFFMACKEVANAYTELNDPVDQKERFLEQIRERARGDEEAHRMDEDYLKALEYGLPPTAGEGIGIDRLVMILTNSPSIRDVILFPTLRPEVRREKGGSEN
ncbi:MAG TPA: lysine--tRNA ligase, partial [Thermosulfidibacter takaii]|nr:lysine--tRNA ligase [Thermosulfidibacter takaii]